MTKLKPSDRLECVSHVLSSIEDSSGYKIQLKVDECRNMIQNITSECEDREDVPTYIVKTMRDIDRVMSEEREVGQKEIVNIRGLIESGLAWSLEQRAPPSDFPDEGLDHAQELGIRTISN